MSELELWNELGNIYFRTGAINEAIRTYQKAIELNPDYPQPYSNLASIFVSQGKYAEAIPMFQKGIELMHGENHQAFLWNQLGDAYRKMEDFTNACASYRKAVELDPQDASFQKNLDEVEPASQFSSAEPVAVVNRNTPPSTEPGNVCWVFEDNKQILPEGENPSDESETAPMILGGRILSDTTTDRPLDPAVGTSTIDPPGSEKPINASSYGLLRLGILHWRKGEDERAIRFLKSAIDSAEKSQNQFHQALSYYAIAQVEAGLGKIEDAIQAYQSAANLAPEKIFPWNSLGNLNCMLDRYEDARAAFQEAIEHDPKDPVSWNSLGDVYHKLGRTEDAIAAYQLGNVFEKHTSDQDALEEFEKALDADQKKPQVWNEAGNIYYDTEAYSDAIASYRKAMELDPTNATFRVSLARAEQALKEANARSKPSTPEAIPQNEAIVANKADEETKKTDLADTLPIKTVSVQEAETVPEPDSHPATAQVDPEPETAFWVYRSVSPHRIVRRSARQYLPANTAKVVETTKLHHAYASQTRREWALSDNQSLLDTVHDHASILVQLPPRADRSAQTEEVFSFPVSKHEGESAAVDDVEPGLRDSASSAAENQAGNSTQLANALGTQPADQSSLDLQVLENDISAYRRVTEINPKNDRAWDTLGNMYENVGLHSQAIAAFEMAIELAPQKEVYHYHLGIALGYQAQYDEAIQALQRVITLNPRYMLAHCALAGYYRKLGREEEAQDHMQIARPSMEDENEYNQACFESIGGNSDRAIALLEIALEKKQIQPGMVLSDPDLDFIRSDPRFEALLAKNKITSK
jgi:tetratricopeptide (TPR) repeat protein